MANITVTPEQLAACQRHEENGTVHYTVTSATDPDGFYTVRWNSAYKCPQDNCKAGRAGEACWHKRAALAAEAIHQAELKRERDEQAQIESYVRQGQSRATAERIVYAKPATSTAKGNLNTVNREFSLLK